MKIVYGAGIDDSDYPTRIRVELPRVNGKRRSKTIWTCPYWSRWREMVGRCCSEKIKKVHPTYENCTIHEDWLYFSKFKMWMEQQDWEGKFLDKDIIIKRNKHYSPGTCSFVSRKANNIILDSATIRGKWPIGVTYKPSQPHRPYVANAKQLDSKNKYLGSFATPEEAHLAWKKEKHRLACLLAESETDIRVKESLKVWFL